MIDLPIESPFQIAVVMYLSVIALLFITKPDFIFNNPKIYYKFGFAKKDDLTGRRKTILPLWLLFLLLAVIIYYIVAVYSSQNRHTVS